RAGRGRVRGAGDPPRADGPGRLPPGAGRPARRRGRVPGHLPRAGAQGGHAPRPGPARPLALRGRPPGRGPAPGPPGPPPGGRTRRRGRERPGPAAETRALATADGARDGDRHELRAVLDEEIGRLPAKYRDPVVLCYLEGLTHEEAALRLRCPVGTVRSRMA